MKFLERILQQTCSHRFGWPHVDAIGRDYQVCLDCGAAYEYDWNGMRRTGRLQPLPAVASAESASSKSPSWSWK